MAAMLLGPNKVIFTSYGRNKRKIETVTSNIIPFHETKLPIVLLVNNTTASSSEIFTGALLDHKRATIVGARTFGKGTLLKVISLPGNNGALRYAFGYYHTPKGSIIEKKGIMPHHRVLVSFEESAKLADQSSLYPGVVKPNKKNSIKDIQLAKAIELLSPKKVVKKPATKKPTTQVNKTRVNKSTVKSTPAKDNTVNTKVAAPKKVVKAPVKANAVKTTPKKAAPIKATPKKNTPIKANKVITPAPAKKANTVTKNTPKAAVAPKVVTK
jgi:hypothetical protein